MKHTISTLLRSEIQTKIDSRLNFYFSETTNGGIDLFTFGDDVSRIVSSYHGDDEGERFLKICGENNFDLQQLSFDNIQTALKALHCCPAIIEDVATTYTNALRVATSTICALLSRGRGENFIREDSHIATAIFFNGDKSTFSISETTKILFRSNRTIERMIKKGELKAIHCGRNWQITKQSIIDFLDNNDAIRNRLSWQLK